MRGTIIAWSGEQGVVHAGAQHYEFDLSHWQGAISPSPNMAVDVATAEGRLMRLLPASEAENASEKPAAATDEGGRQAMAILAATGRDVSVAYGVFLYLAFFVSVISTARIGNDSTTLADLLSGDIGRGLTDSSGEGAMLILMATTTIAVPWFWKHRLATLAFTVPLVLTLRAFWPLYEQHRARQEAVQALSELGRELGQMAEQMAGSLRPFDSLGVCTYLLFATVIYLAVRGVMRALAR